MKRKSWDFSRRVFCCFLSLVCLLLSLSLCACGQETPEVLENEPPSSVVTPSGSPLRAVYPISEIKLNFPGGNGTIVYSYFPSTRTVVRETVLTEDVMIPGVTPESAETTETYLFNSNGRLESYLLEEKQRYTATADEAGSGSATSETVEITVDRTLFRRQFLYENGQLAALIEETPASDSAAVGQTIEKRFSRGEQGFINGAVAYLIQESTKEPPAEDPDSDTDSGTSQLMAVDLASLTSGELASGGRDSSESDDSARSSNAPENDGGPLYRERYEIGAGGLPMYLYGPTEGEVTGVSYTLAGRSIVGRQMRYSFDGQPIWTARYTYGYDEAGRVARIDWTIRYEEGWSGQGPDTLLLPVEGSYSMTLSYESNAPSYMAAACEELRIGSLEQGQSADRDVRLLGPEVRVRSAQ